MVIMKRFMALLTASLLVTSMTVSAAESPSTSVVVKTETGGGTEGLKCRGVLQQRCQLGAWCDKRNACGTGRQDSD